MPDQVRTGLITLSLGRHVVLDSTGAILMAHPFSAVPQGFAVMGKDVLWWGGCAWDSFALPHLLPEQAPVLVSTRCPACDRPHVWNVSDQEPPEGDQVAHFLVPVANMWDDVVRTCAHQRIFCSEACVDNWTASAGRTKGEVLDLPTLWRLAEHWYDGRLQRGYRRRDPAESAQYLREVGLTGAFWGS
ncbi:hypothetical protein EFK50_21150 [Nocardioides marmoriginsengisoli]|uniref:Transmembrane protein n=2 Tax=Nocardioides marmoriginsengisoli TaxID=661483 RepID=A0A3N0CBR5_9ACTN|nr:hypothetical protein EFK50_21150 [Nocardioides marmoriginsengisoli]